MPRARISKSSFNYDNNGRAILGSAKEMTAWVKLGFEEQNKRRIPEEPFQQNIIDLSNCVLFVSYPIGSKNPSSQIFNLCDLAGIVPGIEKIEDDPNYLFEVKLGIRFDGSILYGNFFHYVKIEGPLDFESCVLDGIVTSVKDEGGENNFIKELSLHCCDIKSQYHIESSNIDKFVFSFGKIDESGRLRFSQCKIDANPNAKLQMLYTRKWGSRRKRRIAM